MNDPGLRLRQARTAVEFVAAMRELKELSGLTLRQLEERAQEQGEVLARSTLGHVLGRDRLPREEVVSAFVRACGGDHGEVQLWLQVRRRLAAPQAAHTLTIDEPHAGVTPGAASSAPQLDRKPTAARTRPSTARARRAVGRPLAAAAAACVTVAAFLALWDSRHGTDSSGHPRTPSTSASPRTSDARTPRTPPATPPVLPSGTYRMRTANGECVAERPRHRVGTGSQDFLYATACTNSSSTPVMLRAQADGTYKIMLTGEKNESLRCLGVEGAALNNGADVSLQYCGMHTLDQAEQFTVEAVTIPAKGFRLRPAHTLLLPSRADLCLGAADLDEKPWADIFQMECLPSPRQVFHFHSLSR